MLKLKQSHKNPEEWIIYEPTNFQKCHTHCTHLRIALKIRYLVMHEQLPISTNMRLINSCIRLTKEGPYRDALIEYRDSIKQASLYKQRH